MATAQHANDDDELALSLLNDFLVEEHRLDLLNLLQSSQSVDEPVCLAVDILKLANHDPALAESLIRKPQLGLSRLGEAGVLAQQELLEDSAGEEGNPVKQNVHARLTGLPVGHGSGCVGPELGSICSRHVNSLVIARGTVTHAGPAKVLEKQRHFECSSCGHQFAMPACLEAAFTVQTPLHCPGNQTKPCKGRNFRHMTELQELSDYQEIRLQQKASGSASTAAAAYIDVLLEDDLADSCQPGDDVIVTAVVRQRWKPVVPGVRCDVELCLHANNLAVQNSRKAHVEVTQDSILRFHEFWEQHQDRPLVGRDKLLASICPQMHGMSLVKLAVAILLVGGAPQAATQAPHCRADIHLLLVGDPGVGKSQFLQFAAKVSSRAVMTSGRGSTAAGLTASAVRTGPDWSLEAGAMVLADGGICCIDEFNGLKDGAQTVILEAMEQQTVSVAKAGLLKSLNTRASVLAACNPKDKYDGRVSLSANTRIGSALLSRFDIVLVMRDMKIPVWDSAVADHLLGLDPETPPPGFPPAWDTELLKQYISWAKSFQPTMSPEAEQVLLAYYNNQRQSPMQDASRRTARMLRSLIRISQAHARLMARGVVSQHDALAAIILVDASRVDESMLDCNPMMGPNSDNPDRDFDLVADRLLSKLGLVSAPIVGREEDRYSESSQEY